MTPIEAATAAKKTMTVPARIIAEQMLDTLRDMLNGLHAEERAAVEEHVLRHCWSVYNQRKRRAAAFKNAEI